MGWGQDGAHHDVARNEEDGEHVVVLAHEELEGVDIDSVGVSARGDHLAVVVLVHVRVDRAVVERAMEGRVEGVVHDEEEGEGEAGVDERHLRCGRAGRMRRRVLWPRASACAGQA